MKAILSVLVATVLSASVLRAEPEDMTPAQIESLVAPIALYPDPLVAIILPAATVPDDIALAAKFDTEDRFLGGIEAQPWDPAVKALARYPTVLKWMNDSTEWTNDLGEAFVQQRSVVMRAIQRLRWKAYDAGSLTSTVNMSVVIEGNEIRLVPPTDDIVYVPEYDSAVVYERRVNYAVPCITFGVGYPCGFWMNYYCDWSYCGIWRGPWVRGWDHHHEWRHPGYARDRWHHWNPNPDRHHAFDYRDAERRREHRRDERPRTSLENERYSRATYTQVQNMNNEHNPGSVGYPAHANDSGARPNSSDNHQRPGRRDHDNQGSNNQRPGNNGTVSQPPVTGTTPQQPAVTTPRTPVQDPALRIPRLHDRSESFPRGQQTTGPSSPSSTTQSRTQPQPPPQQAVPVVPSTRAQPVPQAPSTRAQGQPPVQNRDGSRRNEFR